MISDTGEIAVSECCKLPLIGLFLHRGSKMARDLKQHCDEENETYAIFEVNAKGRFRFIDANNFPLSQGGNLSLGWAWRARLREFAQEVALALE